jgi:phosphate transport system substrate-binding protein
VTSWPESSGVTGPVHIYARDDKSGTFDTFKAIVLGDQKLAPSAVRFADGDALAAAVAHDPLGIGFVGMSHLGGAIAVPVSEGAAPPLAPSRFTVATEDYPLSRRLFLYAPAQGGHPLAAQFIAYALSSQGQAQVTAAGFVNLAALPSDAGACVGCSPQYAQRTAGARRLSLDFRFQPGGRDLDSRGQRDLGRLVGLLHSQRDPEVMLLGFSDNVGTADTNAQISRDRAEVVSRALSGYGIHPAVVDGLGQEMPVASNDSPAGRERNRRVEVWIR